MDRQEAAEPRADVTAFMIRKADSDV